MSSDKRKTSLSENSNEQTKKLRSTVNTISSIEDLSNEIFYEIFDYLDGYDIYHAFNHLNSRFQQLFTSSSLLLKLSVYDDGDESQITLEDYCRDVIIPNRHRILSLELIDSTLIDGFLTYCLINETFNRLESITLKDLSTINVPATLLHFKTLPCLFSLSISLVIEDYSSTDFSEIYQIILRLPFLKYNSLMCESFFQQIDMTPLACNGTFSTIKYLIMEHNCTSTKLLSILVHTPQLTHLTCRELSYSDEDFVYSTLPALFNFVYFRIRKCLPIKNLNDLAFFHGHYTEPNQWKQLITEHMPALHRFDMNYYVATDYYYYNFNNIDIDLLVQQGLSQFWVERGWDFEIELQYEGFMYSINPKKKTWFDVNENILHDSTLQKDDRTAVQPYSSINLTIRCFHRREWEVNFLDIYKPILEKIQCTSLYISRSANLSYDSFIETLACLPNLNSLELSFSFSDDFDDLSDKHTKNFHRISMINNIKIIYQRMDFDLTNILIDLCPHMEYLEIDRVSGKNLNKLIRFILEKRLTCIHDLHSICLHMKRINDKRINGLKQMIDSEKLLDEYNIKCRNKDILLQWK